MSVMFEYIDKSDLAATCILEGASRFVRIEAKAFLDVELLFQHEPKLFQKISDDIGRGYRTTEDPPLVRTEQAFLKYFGANWEMSYFGKSKLSIYVRSDERRKQLKAEVQGLMELMQAKFQFYTSYDDFLVCQSEVTVNKKEDARGRTRATPVIDHQFQQVRPLLQKVLDETKEERIELRRKWADRPRIPLEWNWRRSS